MVRIEATELERLFREHHALVFRAAYRVTGNAADAEDVLQSVFLRLMRRDPDQLQNVEGYLRRAAVNAALDLIRARHGIAAGSLDDLAGILPENPSRAPDRLLAAGEIRDWLRQAVARLHPNAATMFVLRFFEGFENAKIAEVLGTTPGTVAVTLSRTRDRLEKEYRSYLGDSL